MRKYIGVIAIVVALSSAFTTNKLRRTANGWYILYPSVSIPGFYANWGSFQLGQYSHSSMYSNSATSGATPTQLIQSGCFVTFPDGNDVVCAIYLQYGNGMYSTILDDGLSADLIRDFPNSAPSSGIKYRQIN